MTRQEKLEILKKYPTDKNLWYVVMIFLLISLIWYVYSIIKVFSSFDFSGMLVILASIMPFAIFALQLLILVEIYRLERWITFWLWVNLILALLSIDLLAIIISIIILVIYKRVINKVYPKPIK